jgi:nucleotide-binding universal stress UspA family protein
MVENQQYKKILLPTDGSKYAKKAEKDALFIAKASNAEIIILSVVENSFSLGLPSDDTTFRINQMLKEEAKKNLESAKEELGEDIKVSTKIGEGSPADVILSTVEDEDIDLVVIGSSGKTGFDRFIMGSVAERVVKSAKCNVLVIH